MSAPIRPDRQTEPAVQPPHPLGVTGGQVLVDRHHVHAVAVEGVEVGRQRGDEGLALAGLHFGNPPEMQGHAPHELHVEVALAQHPPGRLPHDRVRLNEEVVESFALVQALPELHGLVRQGFIAEALHLGLEVADQRDELGQPSDLLALAGAQDLREHAHEGTILPAAEGPEPPPGPGGDLGLRAADLVFDPTLACCEGDAPVPAARRRAAAPNGTVLARIASSPPAPDSRGRSGQGLPLSRTMLSDHKSPYVGRFACDWPRLSTTDPHAARRHPTPGRSPAAQERSSPPRPRPGCTQFSDSCRCARDCQRHALAEWHPTNLDQMDRVAVDVSARRRSVREAADALDDRQVSQTPLRLCRVIVGPIQREVARLRPPVAFVAVGGVGQRRRRHSSSSTIVVIQLFR